MVLTVSTLSKRYVKSKCDLFCMTDLVSQNVEVILNRKTSMEAVIKVIEENIPEVKLMQ